jgi:hypothetical protein
MVRPQGPPLRITFVILALLFCARPALADWMFTPFAGASFGTETTFVTLEPSALSKSKLIFGGSVALLSRGIFGIEADFALAPRFFEDDTRAGIFTGSNLNTLSASAIFAVPIAVTRESLRPYAIVGLGMIHAAANDAIGFLDIHDNMFASNLGGGAIGMISARNGLRFEIRHFRSLKNAPNILTGADATRLSFWRATVGVVIRIAN